jgi:hypothetical protein
MGEIGTSDYDGDVALRVVIKRARPDPVPKCEELYDRLALDFNEAARRTIANFTSEKNPDAVSLPRYGRVPLDGRTSIDSWGKRTGFRRDREDRCETQDVWPKMYAERDWDVQAHAGA